MTMGRAPRTITSPLAASTLRIGAAAQMAKSTPSTPVYAVEGVVKSVTNFFLAITAGSGKNAREMNFVLNPATDRSGNVTIGARVSIRYRVENHVPLATAIAAHVNGRNVAHPSRL
jgi:hypothetical protein